MKKLAQPMSPRTQAFQQGMPSGDEEQRLFEEGLSSMAYNVLVSKFPDLIQNVITFKILDTDVEGGAGIGSFVVQHGNEVIYIPVVMADNQVKPLDLFYHKGLNVFLPLNNDWLNEVSQLTIDEMGEAVKQPQSLRRDVDTRNILIPPTTGRYAYAGARGPVTDGEVINDLQQMMVKLQPRALEKLGAARPALLLEFLARAPRVIKTAFTNILTSRPKLAAQVTQLYGLDPLCAALEKQGADEGKTTVDEEGDLNIADRKTTASKFKDIFGTKAPEAFQGTLAKGYAAQDNRKGLKRAVQIQEPKDLIVPDKSGFYQVFTADGDVKSAFIITNPRRILSSAGEGPELAGAHGRRPGGRAPEGPHHPGCECGLHDDFLVILKNGESVQTKKLVAEPAWGLAGYDPSEEVYFKQLLGKDDGAQPHVGDRGVFVKKLGQTFVATEPFHVAKVATDSQGVRRITCDDFNSTVLVTDPKAAKAGLHQPKGTHLVYIPADARFVRLKEREYSFGNENVTLLSKPSDVLRLFTSKFDAMGAPEVAVKNAGAGQFSIDGEPARNKVAAMEYAARKHHIHFSAAENLVKQAELLPHGRVAARVVTEVQLTKIAQPMMDPSMGGAPPPGGAMPPGGDPSMMGGAPPPPPAPPSPLDIAMGEAQSQMQQQVAALQTQSQAIQDTAQMLMQVQQRAQSIATGGAAAVQQGSPPLMPGAAGGAAAPPTAPPAAAPAPSPMGIAPAGGPPAGSAPAGGAPPQAGDMPGPADQMPAGGMGAVMQTETPSAMEIQQQVNPQFLEQAGQFNDQGVFDAAAIASIGHSPSFRDMVVDYVPTLERALDNLGRIMLTLWMQEGELKQQFGDEEFSKIEDNLRAVHEGLGELILQMNRNAIVMPASPNASGMDS